MLTRKRNCHDVESMSDGMAASPGWRISDFSSDEENESCALEFHEGRQPASPLSTLISWSSDEEDGKAEKSNSLLNNSYIRRSCTSKQKVVYNKRTPLTQIGIKRKGKHECMQMEGSPRKALTPRNILSSQNDDDGCEGTDVSPWRKVRKVFAPLRRSLINTIDNEVEKSPIKGAHDVILETRIDWSDSSSEAGSPFKAKSQSVTQQSSAPTELDLMVALIEREYGAKGKKDKHEIKGSNGKRRRCRKGGFLEHLQRLRDSKRAQRKFLQHDQQLGLQIGARLRVLQLEGAFGVHMAKVALDSDGDESATFTVVLHPEMAEHTKVGNYLNSFFEEDEKPYELCDIAGKNNELVYIQPHKLLLP